MGFLKYLTIGICYTAAPCLLAVSAGNSSTSLDEAIKTANAGTDTTITFTENATLTEQVRAVNSDPTFTWASQNITINGNNNRLTAFTRALFVGGRLSSNTGTVTINDLIITNAQAQGGRGSDGGGGGLGAGGGLFVGKDTVVTLKNCRFQNCFAIGGIGTGSPGTLGGGGGGMKGSGGRGGSGGGGGFGGNGVTAGGGCSGFSEGNAVGNSPGRNFDGVGSPGSSGVGGELAQMGGFGGGGGGSADASFTGGEGGFGGGGGSGGGGMAAGNGGFGGGGGSATLNGSGGNGGFGGGGGRGTPNGTSLFGGGPIFSNFGGSGAALGGAIFMELGSQLTIEGTIAFSGNQAIRTGGGTALGNDIFMMSSSLLTFDITSDVTFRTPIHGDRGAGGGSTATGSGGLLKKGPATLTLFGDNTYTGGTTVQVGKLLVTGSSLLGDVKVDSGATLGGAFRIIDGNLTNDGTIDPGEDELGTIEVGGDFINNGIVQANIQPGFLVDNDAIAVDGQTILGAGSTLVLFPLPGNYIAGTDFIIIEGATSGIFGTVVEAGPLADLLDFGITYSSVIATVLNNRIFEDQNITAGPAKAVVGCVLAAIPITPHSDFAQMIEELGTLSDKEVNQALVNISPVQYGALEWINARNNSYIASLLSQFQFELCCSPRDCCSCTCNSNVWINGFGNFMNNHGKLDNLQPYTANAGGVLAGVDYCFGSCYYIGVSFGYVRTDLDWKRRLGHGEMNTYLGALYGIFKGSCLNIDFSLIGGGTENDVHRHLEFGDVSRTAKSDFWTQFFTAHLGLRTNWEYCCFNLEPFALFDYHFFHRDSFHEHGAQSLNLDVKSKNQNMMRLEAGLKGYYSIICECYCFAPYLGLSYVGESPFGKSHQKASFTNQSCVIDATAYDSWVNLGSGEAGIKWTNVNGFSFVVGYKGLFNTKTSINEVEGRLEWVF